MRGSRLITTFQSHNSSLAGADAGYVSEDSSCPVTSTYYDTDGVSAIPTDHANLPSSRTPSARNATSPQGRGWLEPTRRSIRQSGAAQPRQRLERGFAAHSTARSIAHATLHSGHLLKPP